MNKEPICSTLYCKSLSQNSSLFDVEPSTSHSTTSVIAKQDEKRKLENDDHDYLATPRFSKRKKNSRHLKKMKQ